MANSFLGLSLFIMLLSFFIVMNSVSSFETTKVSPIINSIEMAFGAKLDAKELAKTAPKPHDLPQDKEGDTLEDIKGAFGAHIKDYQLNKNRLGTVMTVEMTVEEFELSLRDIDVMRETGKSVTREQSFIPTLISLIDSAQGRTPYRMDLFVQVPASKITQTSGAFVKQAGRYGHSLELAGLERKLLSAGLMEGEQGRITMIFRRYEPVKITAPVRIEAESEQAL